MNKELLLENIKQERIQLADEIMEKHSGSDSMKFIHRIFYDEEKNAEEHRWDAREIRKKYIEQMIDPLRMVAKIEVKKKHSKLK